MPIRALDWQQVSSGRFHLTTNLTVIVRQLALQYPKSPSNNGPLLIYLTARNQGRGEEAVKTLHNDAELKKAKVLKADGGTTEIKYHSLDISETNSSTSFAEYLNKEHPDGIDIVINNAGIAMDGFGACPLTLNKHAH